MKFLLILGLCFAVASAKLYPRELVVEPIETIEDEGRITNGQTASAGQFPYQVGLSLRVNALSSAWCGGSLISSTWVLTAAHCTDGISSITVYLGATNRNSPEVTRTTSDITIHSGWNAKTLRNDISLVKISSVAFTSRIQVVKLPAIAKSYSTYVGSMAIASGWGRTSDSSNAIATNLQYARMEVVDNSVCAKYFGSSTITASLVCVATPKKVSTCNGDSGGPLVLESSKLLIGLTSFGAAAGCEKGHPIAFTRVTSFLDWIKDKSGVSY